MNSELRIKSIGVIGAGTMGNGIAHVSALSGFDTILMDIKDEFANKDLPPSRKIWIDRLKKKKSVNLKWKLQ